MVFTQAAYLPTEEELSVQEINISTSGLRAASFHMGKACETVNNEFMLCRAEERDPRKCINEGKAVTGCSLDFFRGVKKSCAQEFTQFAHCLDKSSADYSFEPCRKTQSVFDKCVADNLGLERPYYGYFSEVKVHHTDRPRPQGIQEIQNPDPAVPVAQETTEQTSKFGSRKYFMN